MFNYLKGKVTIIESNYIVVDVNNIGYEVYVSNPYSYELDKEVTVYLYNHIREVEHTLYGFKNIEEKELFLRLINVKGLGPKVALPMFATGSVAGIIDAIERENIIYLKKFPKIGDKIARQVILDLKGKLVKGDKINSVVEHEELILALEGLGYRNNDIKKIIPQVDPNKTIEEQIKDALKSMMK